VPPIFPPQPPTTNAQPNLKPFKPMVNAAADQPLIHVQATYQVAELLEPRTPARRYSSFHQAVTSPLLHSAPSGFLQLPRSFENMKTYSTIHDPLWCFWCHPRRELSAAFSDARGAEVVSLQRDCKRQLILSIHHHFKLKVPHMSTADCYLYHT
jgi:hypothetical protein